MLLATTTGTWHGRACARRAATGVLACACLLTACSQAPTAPRLIEKVLQTVPNGQATVTQRLELPADTDVEIVVRLQDIDVRAELVAGNSVRRADAPNDRLGVITFYEPAAAARSVQLRLIGEDHLRNHGTVTVTVHAMPNVRDADRTRLDAVQLEAQACQEFAAVERGAASASAFEGAAALRREVGDVVGAARDQLHAAATHFVRLNDWERSRELAQSAAALLEDVAEPALEARAVRLEGAALQAKAQTLVGGARKATYAEARTRLSEAAALAERHRLPYEAAYAINYRGVTHQYQGQARAARTDYERALALFTEAGHAPGRSLSIDSLALLHHEQGEFRAAVARFDEALALTSAAESPASYAYTLHNSALPLRVLGEFDAAIARYQQAAQLLRATGDRTGEARAMQGIAMALRFAGEPDRAAALLGEVIGHQGDRDGSRERFSALTALADIEREAGRLRAAHELLEQARPLAASVIQEARVTLGMCKVERARQRPAEARREALRLLALDLPPTHPHRGEAWLELAKVEATAGDATAAMRAFDAALAIAGDNGTELDVAKALADRAQFLLGRNDPTTALADTRRAIGILEAVGEAGTHSQQRAVFLGSQRQLFELQIAAQLVLAAEAERAGRMDAAESARFDALATSERSRMGGLLEALRTAGQAPSTAIVRQRKELFELLAGKRQRREALLEQMAPDPAVLAELTRAITSLRAELGTLNAQMDRGATRPGFAAAAAADDGRRLAGVVPATDLLAEYFVGETRSWLFLVRDGRIDVRPLPAGAVMEEAVRASVARWRAPQGGASARAPSGAALRASVVDPLANVDPVSRLWVVPDGPLHAVPLAAVLNEEPGWLSTVEVVAVPSLRAVAQATLRTATASSTAVTSDRGMLAVVIADPIFTRDDPRLAVPELTHVDAATTAEAPALAMLTRSSVALAELPRLPATASEARAIAELFPAERTLSLSGAAATRDAVLRADLGQVRNLHFATHAFADSEDPDLSALVLSRFGLDGRALDGTLRLHDVEALQLDADLVVLSGCETALGRDIRGEGLVGLSYGFLRAGARTVMASLWRVPDTATAVLMHEFYRQILKEQRSPALALRLAQDVVRSHPRWADPYYWAGFQVVTVVPPGVLGT